MHRNIAKCVSGVAADESGATAIEYALIAVLVSIVIVGALQLIGADLLSLYERIAAAFP